MLAPIAQLLHARGVATIGTNLVLNNTPASPDTTLVLRATGGIYDQSNIAHPYTKFTFQVESRALSMQTAEQKITSVFSILQNLGGDVNGTWFVEIVALQPAPMYLLKDSQNRHVFVQNYRAEIRLDTENRYM